MGPWGAVCDDVEQFFVFDLFLRLTTQGTSRAETQHRLLTKTFTGADKFWDPGVLCVKF